MARSVFYDPFGQRLAGEQAGMRDEAFMQDQTRRARQSDYDFNVTQPIQLRDMQRNSAFGDYADPFLRRNLGFQENITKGSIYDAEVPRRDAYTRATGDQNLARQLDAERYPADGTQAGQVRAIESPLIQAWDDWQGIQAQEGITDPTSPEAQAWQAEMEQLYGLQPGGLLDFEAIKAALAAPPQFTQGPQVQTRTNPQTGQMEAIPNNPNGYTDRAFQPQAYQAAQLGLSQYGAQARMEYNNALNYQTKMKGQDGGASGGPEYENYGGD